MPCNLEYIGNNAFSANKLKVIDIPSNVEYVDYRAFADNGEIIYESEELNNPSIKKIIIHGSEINTENNNKKYIESINECGDIIDEYDDKINWINNMWLDEEIFYGIPDPRIGQQMMADVFFVNVVEDGVGLDDEGNYWDFKTFKIIENYTPMEDELGPAWDSDWREFDQERHIYYLGDTFIGKPTNNIVKQLINLDWDTSFLVLTNDGRVFAKGVKEDVNEYGQLGVGHYNDVNEFTQILEGEIITKLYKSNNHMFSNIFALTEDGRVYGWGGNNAYNNNPYYGTICTGAIGGIMASDEGLSGMPFWFSTPISIGFYPGDVKIRDIVADNEVTFYIDTNNNVYMSGYDQLHCIRKNDGTTGHMKKIEELENIDKIIIDRDGWDATRVYAFTFDGEIYSWGLNTELRLGLGYDNENYIQEYPEKITNENSEVISGIKKLSFSNGFTSLILENKEIYVYGDLIGTATPTNNFENKDFIDYDLSTFDKEIDDIWISWEYSGKTLFWVIAEGKLYVYCNGGGVNDYKIGLGMNVWSVETLTEVGNFDNNIVKYYDGDDVKYVILNNGQVWAWGQNRFGDCGNGGNTTVFVPNRVGYIQTTIWKSILS